MISKNIFHQSDVTFKLNYEVFASQYLNILYSWENSYITNYYKYEIWGSYSDEY
jgi:hypothetical protein